MPPSAPTPGKLGDSLTARSYWDSVHQESARSALPAVSSRATGEARVDAPTERVPGSRRMVPATALRWIRDSFAQDEFWNRLLPRHVPQDPNATVLEIGVAPGDEVLHFHRRFGHAPFGIEFSPAGAEAARRNFAANGIRTSNVIEGDLFDDALSARHESAFDVVFSRGFIEHFTNPAEVIGRHLRLAKPGGLVVISIPTLTGFHYLLTRALMPQQIAIHNRAIMRLKPFRQLFERADLETLFCGYQGGPNLLISYTPNPTGFRAALQWWTIKLQGLANVAGWASGGRLLRGPFLNGSLLFIGRKRA